MRVLHLVTRSHARGAERVAVELADELDRLGFDDQVLALAPAFDGSRDVRIPVLGSRPGLGAPRVATAAWQLRRQLRRQPADVILAHGGSAAQVAALARRRHGPAVVWQRILPFPADIWRPWSRTWWRWVVHRMDAAVALTPELGAELRRLGYRGPLWPIGNFRDPRRFADVDRAAARAGLRSELGVAEDVPLLGLVGQLVDQKRPERAVDVVAQLERAGYDAHLVVAGDGPGRDALEHHVRARGVEERTHLVGHRADVEWVLAGLDLLLLTSDAEGIPGVLIEAQMSGCPVVTYPVGGVAAVVDHGETGVILDRADTETMARAVEALLDHPQRARDLGEEARRRSDRFSIHHVAADYAAGLRSITSAP